MAVQVKNAAGEVVTRADSDWEAGRWYLAEGREGDYLADTDELMSTLVVELGIVTAVAFDRNGCVVPVGEVD